MPRPTPFHARTSALNQGNHWEEWAGFESATQFELSFDHEYHAVRNGCGMFDVSPLYKYDVRGPDAHALLNRVVVRDLSKARVGQVFYTVWCDDRGKVVDDGTIMRLGEEHFRMTAAIPTLYWLEDNATGMDVEIEDTSESIAAVALQGPTSRDLIQRLTTTNLDGLRFFRCTDAEIAGFPVVISRAGFTGDLGFEIFTKSENALALWDALMEIGPDYQMRPAGAIALDVARVEAGLILIDLDFVSSTQTLYEVQKTSPYELGLGWMVKLDQSYFVGRDALREEKKRGTTRVTVGLELDVKAIERCYAEFDMPLHVPHEPWKTFYPIYSDAARRNFIGRGSSGVWSSTLKKYVVIARVEAKYEKLGTVIYFEESIEAKSFAIPATVVRMPFFDPPRKKAIIGGSK
ncbi:MAG: aminomethyl transferase family protein [Myxococcales bacterium]|nr:aminomethyl transferase family protein [Myxococcales bacterium]